MTRVRVFAAVAACRFTRWLLRITGRGGTALPGKIALKLCPGLLGYLAKDVKTVAVTGTNGKTTSSRMIEQAFSNAGMSYFANRSGSNLIQGITAEFAANSTLTGRNRKEYAVIECDEAACMKVLGFIKPKVLVVTNIFRDQLDRFGEVTTTLGDIREGITHTPETVLCLNADCSLTASLAGDLPNRCVFYGVNVPIYRQEVTELSDAQNCIRCKAEYEYDWRTYGHLGGFRCPSCGYSRPEPQVAVTAVNELASDSSTVGMSIFGEDVTARINLPAAYNIYNAAGAAAALAQMGFTTENVLMALGSFECGFGRMESFSKDGCDIRMILVKNPAGCNQVLSFLCELDEPSLFVICLNDNIADGTDISWIWDAAFEKLAELGDRLTGVLVSGTRRDDMVMRLKYAGLPEEKVSVIADRDELINRMCEKPQRVFIMPTYTAMLELRAKLSQATGANKFWE